MTASQYLAKVVSAAVLLAVLYRPVIANIGESAAVVTPNTVASMYSISI